ncbi:hypothetical protein GQX74_001679 [Glossina fuscipes]|nr:hypothetical protein GQX74_001679 [Glossina fuscipes]
MHYALMYLSPLRKLNFTSILQLIFDFAQIFVNAISILFPSNDNMTSATVTKSIPDTITSWVITAFAVNEKTGLGMTEKPFKINVFQPFFIDVNLPYSVKRGEVIAIPVIIFNYMDKTLDAEITMDNTDKEYDFTEVSNEIEESILSTQKRMKRVSVPPNSGESVSFMIRPAVVADIELKISAASQLAGDAIHKKLKVEAEGVTQYENQALFLNLEEPHKASLEVDIPPEAVKDSEYVEFSINICANYQPAVDDEINESNMAVMEVALPSGYVADSEKLNDILAADRVQRIDTESSDTKVIVYLDGLVEDEQVCVTIVADKAFAVAKQKPVPVTLYDYYNSAYRGTEYYRIESSLCDICEGDDCGTAYKVPN